MQTILAIRHFSDRKKPCLMIEQGNQGIILASFRNKHCAEIVEEFLGRGYVLAKEERRTLDEIVADLYKDLPTCEEVDV